MGALARSGRAAGQSSAGWNTGRAPGAALLFLGGASLAAAPLVRRVSAEAPDGIRLCLVKAATGLPCPLCGGTRAAAALGEGALLDALAWNPLAALGIGLAVAAGAALLLGWRPGAAWRGPGVRVAGLAAIALNWTYLVAVGR